MTIERDIVCQDLKAGLGILGAGLPGFRVPAALGGFSPRFRDLAAYGDVARPS